VELIVRDTGTGIQTEIPLFERFHRVEADTFEERVLDCRWWELVHLHGGAIAVKSTLGQGSTFSVQLPIVTAHLSDREAASKLIASTSVVFNLPPLPVQVLCSRSVRLAARRESMQEHPMPRFTILNSCSCWSMMNADMRNLYRILSQFYEVEVFGYALQHAPHLTWCSAM